MEEGQQDNLDRADGIRKLMKENQMLMKDNENERDRIEKEAKDE